MNTEISLLIRAHTDRCHKVLKAIAEGEMVHYEDLEPLLTKDWLQTALDDLEFIGYIEVTDANGLPYIMGESYKITDKGQQYYKDHMHEQTN